MDKQSKIIVVSGDTLTAAAVQRHLAADGHDIRFISRGQDLAGICRRERADLVLLDLDPASGDALGIASELVASVPAAVILLTSRDGLQDLIRGLDAGADDYITKPFEPDELRARVRMVLRRLGLLGGPEGIIRAGPFSLDAGSMVLSCRDGAGRVRLTETENRILSVLMQQHDRAVSRAALSNGDSLTAGDRSVDVHVANIRAKLRDAGFEQLIIWSVRGLGYRLRVERN
jgi:DNA-binding response OmpR family regulator